MTRFQRLRKILAIATALLLLAAFVLYRTGVIGTHFMSASKSTFVFTEGQSIKPTPEPKAAEGQKASTQGQKGK